MGWTAGYASDIEYTAGFYREQSPSWLNLVCLLNGVQPVPLDRPYNYFELGFGRGLTATLLAASNPGGQFYAADFNPVHVAGARTLAQEAQLSNLTLLENSFEQLADGEVELPQFDFITLHGIYTWVTLENRRHIVRFISRYLKPGGLVYISYNAMPGWSPSLPLQRLLVEYADAFPNRSDVQIKGATEFLTQMAEAKAGYLQQNPSVGVRLASLKTSNPNYLVHEYLHKHWQPLFHADVARDLAEAKMTYAGSAELHGAYPAIFLNETQRQLIDKLPHSEMRETIKDYMYNTSFRKDVFVHGAVRLSPLRQAELMAQLGVLLTVPRAAASVTMKLPNGEVNGAAQLYTPVLDALAQRPHTLAELSGLPALAGQNMQSVAQIVALLTASNQAVLYLPAASAANGEAAWRLNLTLAAQARYSDEHQALGSPLLGSAVAANYLERLFYLALRQAPEETTPAALARSAWQIMAPLGRRMQRDGTTLESVEDNLAELTRTASVFVTDKLPLWRTLKLL
jgi:SAM-dependent methyltransferase